VSHKQVTLTKLTIVPEFLALSFMPMVSQKDLVPSFIFNFIIIINTRKQTQLLSLYYICPNPTVGFLTTFVQDPSTAPVAPLWREIK